MKYILSLVLCTSFSKYRFYIYFIFYLFLHLKTKIDFVQNKKINKTKIIFFCNEKEIFKIILFLYTKKKHKNVGKVWFKPAAAVVIICNWICFVSVFYNNYYLIYFNWSIQNLPHCVVMLSIIVCKHFNP